MKRKWGYSFLPSYSVVRICSHNIMIGSRHYNSSSRISSQGREDQSRGVWGALFLAIMNRMKSCRSRDVTTSA